MGKSYEKILRETGEWTYVKKFDVPVKGTDKEWQEGSEEVYNYLLCAVGPLEGEYEPGLPEAGFLYPAFRQRSTACNYINLYETAAYQNLWNLLWK